MRLKTYGTVGQPPEIEKLYRNFPALDQRKTAPVAVGQGVWKLVNDVNKRVNGSIRYTNKSPTDWAGPQQQTHTSGLTGKQVETLVGSCRDYVITKMLELQAQGVPLGAMRIADAYLDGPNVAPEDRHHMVLLLQQEDGRAWILDNRTPEIYDWPGLPHYRWNRVSQPGSEQWGRLTPQQAIGLDAVLQSMASGVPGDGA